MKKFYSYFNRFEATARMTIVAEAFVFVGVFVALSVFIGWWKKQKNDKLKCHPPAFPSIPIFGSLPFLRNLNNIPEFFLKCSYQLGPIFTVTVGQKEILILNSKDVIEDAFINHLHEFSGRTPMYVDSYVNIRSKGLSFKSTDVVWKRLHRLCLNILKEFGFGVKNQMEEIILTEVEAMVHYVKRIDGRTIDPRNTIAMVVTNVMNNIVFGQRRDYDKGIGELYVQMERLFQGFDLNLELSHALRFLPRFRAKILTYKDSQEKISEILTGEIERCKEPEAEDCFTKRYLQKEGSEIDEEQLLWTLRDLVAAGTDTVISTLLISLAALANHKVIQDRMRAEIDAVVPRSRFPTMDDQRNLPYTEATILEVMRYWTLVPLSLPRLTLSDVKLKGYFIRAGTQVLANLHAAQMDPKMWVDPNEFRPERFLDKDNKVFGKDRIIPFSLGRRSCLGEVLARAEIFLILSAIVQNFQILPPEGHETAEAKPFEPVGLVLIPLPFNIRLVPRI